MYLCVSYVILKMAICINEFDTVFSCMNLSRSTLENYPVCNIRVTKVLSLVTFSVHIEIESTFLSSFWVSLFLILCLFSPFVLKKLTKKVQSFISEECSKNNNFDPLKYYKFV